jgi:hypothetical protein
MMLFTRDFWSVAFERMVKTIAQVMVATITASTFIPTVGDQWIQIGVTSGLAGLVSVLTSLTSYDAVKKTIDAPIEADVKLATDIYQRMQQGPTAAMATDPSVSGAAVAVVADSKKK